MWNCSLTQQILSHSFYDWKLYELFLLTGFLICHAVGWYIELKNQKFDGGYLRERSWFQIIQKIFRVFQNPHVIYATTRVNSFAMVLLSLFYCRQNLCQVNRQFCLCFEVSPTHYCTGDVVYLIPLKKNIPGFPIDVVAVNYAVFAISIFINYYLWCTCILCQILQKRENIWLK